MHALLQHEDGFAERSPIIRIVYVCAHNLANGMIVMVGALMVCEFAARHYYMRLFPIVYLVFALAALFSLNSILRFICFIRRAAFSTRLKEMWYMDGPLTDPDFSRGPGLLGAWWIPGQSRRHLNRASVLPAPPSTIPLPPPSTSHRALATQGRPSPFSVSERSMETED